MSAVDPRCYQRASDTLWRRFEGGLLLLGGGGQAGDEPTVVGGIGPLLWHLLAEPRSVDELVTEVRTATGPSAPDPATVRADLDIVLEDLVARQLVRRVHAA